MSALRFREANTCLTINGHYDSADGNRLRSAEYWHSLLPGSMHDKPDIDQEFPFYR